MTSNVLQREYIRNFFRNYTKTTTNARKRKDSFRELKERQRQEEEAARRRGHLGSPSRSQPHKGFGTDPDDFNTTLSSVDSVGAPRSSTLEQLHTKAASGQAAQVRLPINFYNTPSDYEAASRVGSVGGQHSCPGGENWHGTNREVIEQAEYGLDAARAIIESKAWEPLVEQAPKGQRSPRLLFMDMAAVL